MKQKRLTGTTVPQFTYDTPYQAENDFYALCAGETPLMMVFLPNFGHPISRAYITAYAETLPVLTAGRIACVVRSDPARIAESLGGMQMPFTIICDAEGVLYDYFEVRTTTSIFDWTFAARRIINAAKKEGYHPTKGEGQTLPLTLVLGEEGKVIYAHRARSLTDLPEDCEAVQSVCQQLAARHAAVMEAAHPALETAQAQEEVGDIPLAVQAQGEQVPAAQAASSEAEHSAMSPTDAARQEQEGEAADAKALDAQPDPIESVQGEVAPKKINVDWFDAPAK